MKKQYPPQTGPYVVKVSSRQSTDHWQNFDTARLQISVGQQYHEGDKLSSLITWCKSRFNKVVVCANDTLQRFNVMFESGLSEQRANELTAKLGQGWVKRATPLIADLDNVRIVRWDEWKANKEYPKGLLSTEWLYANNNEFKQAIDQNMTDIWQRRSKTHQDLYVDKNFKRFTSLSRQYLLEETAVFSMMYEGERAIDIYPGTVLFAATRFREMELEGAPRGLGKGHFCRVDFRKNKNFEL